MRIAVLSDIHGNSLAFDAVLADIDAHGGVDGYWILGDLVALGPDPVGVLTRVQALANVQCIRGNTDRYVTLGDRPFPSQDDAAADTTLIPSLVEVANTFAWTQGMVTSAGWFAWLALLPVELRVTLPDGTEFLGVHASPGRDDGHGIGPETSSTHLATLVADCGADLICVGHTHRWSEHHVDGQHVVSLAPVSLALDDVGVAGYCLLDASDAGYTLVPRHVPYDRHAVIGELEQVRHPGRAFLITQLGGTDE